MRIIELCEMPRRYIRSYKYKKKKTPKRNFWTPQFFYVSSDIFRVDIAVAVNLSEKEIINHFKKTANTKANNEIMEKIKDWDKDSANITEGRMLEVQGGFLVLLKLEKKFRKAVGNIVHEMTHISQYLLKNRDIALEDEGIFEVQSYLLEHLVTQTLYKLYS